jgi:hypothetical protein
MRLSDYIVDGDKTKSAFFFNNRFGLRKTGRRECQDNYGKVWPSHERSPMLPGRWQSFQLHKQDGIVRKPFFVTQ